MFVSFAKLFDVMEEGALVSIRVKISRFPLFIPKIEIYTNIIYLFISIYITKITLLRFRV